MSGLRVEEIREAERFLALRDAWISLVSESGHSLFNDFDWTHAWHGQFGAGRQIRILAAYQGDGRLVGLFPMVAIRQQEGPRPYHLAMMCGDSGGSHYLDVIARPEQQREMSQLFLEYIRDQWKDWCSIELHNIDVTSPTYLIFSEMFSGLRRREERDSSVYERFPAGETVESYLARSPKSSNYLRRRRWFEKQPGFRIDVAEDPDPLLAAMDDLVRLQQQHWGEKAYLAEPPIRDFLRELLRRWGPRKMARIYRLELEGKAIATALELTDGRRLHHCEHAFDPGYQNRSPGLVLIGQTLQQAIITGCQDYELGYGELPWKFDWASRTRTCSDLRVFAAEATAP